MRYTMTKAAIGSNSSTRRALLLLHLTATALLATAVAGPARAQSTGIAGFIQQAGSGWTASKIVAEIVKWAIRLVAIQAAASILGLTQISAAINAGTLAGATRSPIRVSGISGKRRVSAAKFTAIWPLGLP